MNHARSIPRATSAPPPRPVRRPARQGQVRSARGGGLALGGLRPRPRPAAEAGPGARSLRGTVEADVRSWLAGRALAGSGQRERLVGGGQPAGRGLAAVLPPTPSPTATPQRGSGRGAGGPAAFANPPARCGGAPEHPVVRGSLFSEQPFCATLGDGLGRYL